MRVDPRQVAVLMRKSPDDQFADKTLEIADVVQGPGTTQVRHSPGGHPYSYRPERVLLLFGGQPLQLGDRTRVLVHGQVWPNIAEAYRFDGPDGSWWHLLTDKGRWHVRSGTDVGLVENGLTNLRVRAGVDYLRAVAELLPSDGESLRRAYRALRFVHPDSALYRFLAEEPIASVEPPPTPPVYPFHTNLSQREAIDNALRFPLSVIDGPPGTGKTQTILNLIARLLLDDTTTVAVVSSNNAAVDNVNNKLTEEGFGYVAANLGKREKRERFLTGQSARNRLVSDLVQVSEVNPPSDQDLIRIDQQLRSLQATEREAAQLRAELDGYRLERTHFMIAFDQHRLPDPELLPVARWNAAKILDFIADTDIDNLPAGRVARAVGRVTGWLRYRTMRAADTQDVDLVLRLQKLYYDRKAEEISRRLADLHRTLAGGDFTGKLRRQREQSARAVREQLRMRYGAMERRIYQSNTLWKVRAEFHRDYPVVLSTCHSLPDSIGTGRLLDYLVIDEASQVDLLAAGVAMAYARNVVIVGDLRQLPHIPSVAEEALPTPPSPVLDYRLHSVLSATIDRFGSALPRVILREHYRCDPDIIGFCNRKFYRDELIPYTHKTTGTQSMAVYRTAPGNHMRQHRGGGRTNQREVDVIAQEVVPKFCADAPSDRIGVTTPYRKQVDKIADALISEIEADTVHSFQGREKEVIIMTTVLDETWRGRTGLQFADDPQLVNVAVSRAARQFVLVTNYELLAMSRHLHDLIGYIGYHNPGNPVYDSVIVSVFDLLYRDYSERLRPLATRLVQRSKHRSENIMATILGDLLAEDAYRDLIIHQQMYVKNLIPDSSRLTESQRRYVKNRASVDFVVSNRITRSFVCAIEVDGFAFHENSPEQLVRDRLKDSIFEAYAMPLFRFPTTGSEEPTRLRAVLAQFGFGPTP